MCIHFCSKIQFSHDIIPKCGFSYTTTLLEVIIFVKIFSNSATDQLLKILLGIIAEVNFCFHILPQNSHSIFLFCMIIRKCHPHYWLIHVEIHQQREILIFAFEFTFLFHFFILSVLIKKLLVKQNTMQNWPITFGLHIQQNFRYFIIDIIGPRKGFHQFTN